MESQIGRFASLKNKDINSDTTAIQNIADKTVLRKIGVFPNCRRKWINKYMFPARYRTGSKINILIQKLRVLNSSKNTYAYGRRNSAQIIAVAIATLRDSLVWASAG